MTTKVKTTEIYKDSQGEHIVVKGELVLIDAPIGGHNNMIAISLPNNRLPLAQISVIISETEEIEVNDYFIDTNRNYRTIYQFNEDDKKNSFIPKGHKVLVLPEHFSPKHLQAIIDGKLKDGDEVFVECEDIGSEEWTGDNQNGEPFWNNLFQIVLLTPNPHIKLFPIKKEETWDEAMRILSNPDISWGTKEAMIREKFNPPTKRK